MMQPRIIPCMEAFDEFNAILDKLLSPEGCPWDREQTLQTLRSTVLEETCELIEAINLNDNRHIAEELGDLFLNALFFCKMGEKEGRFTTESVLKNTSEKLIRRHPHVFGDTHVADSEGVITQWEKIKQAEAHHNYRKSALDGIPKELPALARAFKMLKKMAKAKYDQLPAATGQKFSDEEALGEALFALVSDAQHQGLDAEQALRKCLAKREKEFRDWETG